MNGAITILVMAGLIVYTPAGNGPAFELIQLKGLRCRPPTLTTSDSRSSHP